VAFALANAGLPSSFSRAASAAGPALLAAATRAVFSLCFSKPSALAFALSSGKKL
jgi:hypothetical protein